MQFPSNRDKNHLTQGRPTALFGYLILTLLLEQFVASFVCFLAYNLLGSQVIAQHSNHESFFPICVHSSDLFCTASDIMQVLTYHSSFFNSFNLFSKNFLSKNCTVSTRVLGISFNFLFYF